MENKINTSDWLTYIPTRNCGSRFEHRLRNAEDSSNIVAIVLQFEYGHLALDYSDGTWSNCEIMESIAEAIGK